MSVYQNIKLDVNRINTFSVINAKQGDSGRMLKVQITINDEPYYIPRNAYVIFRATKPDDTFVYNFASVQSDGTCTIQLSQETLASPGKIYCDLSVLVGRSTVSSVTFVIFNDKFPRSPSSITSANEYLALSNLVTYLSNYSSKVDRLANGRGITASLENDILTVTKDDSI